MEQQVLARVRADAGVIAAAGEFGGAPAVDFEERKSNAASAFPAAILTTIAGIKLYDQDGAKGARTWRIRFETFSLGNADGAVALGEAIIAALEPAAVTHGIRFGRGFLALERGGGVEDVGDLRIFRRIVDLNITATY
jgi:hypothetical protein